MSRATISSTEAVPGRSSTIGLTLVRRKWSGQLVPSSASRGCSAEARKSSTSSESVKWPTIGRSFEAIARTVGAIAAALARRSSAGSAAYPSRAGPNGSALLFAAMYSAAVSMIFSELASHSSLVSPHAVTPWPPRMQPIACGFCALISAMSRPSWKPGRRHGTQTTVSPKILWVSSSPSAAVAIAMPESGCRWSTWAESTSPCIAVSIDGAAPPLPCRQ